MSGLGHSTWQTFRGTFHRLATLKAEGLDSFRPDMIRIPVTDGVLQSELRFLMIGTSSIPDRLQKRWSVNY